MQMRKRTSRRFGTFFDEGRKTSAFFFRSSLSQQKSQLLYRSCLDLSGNIEALGADPLRAVIADVGGWSLSGTGMTKGGGRFSLRQKLRAVQRYNSNALFHWYVREGMYNTSQYELFIHQGRVILFRTTVMRWN